jgi:non-canonical poly(A) RNA polymerase PAPD5/7
LQKDLNVPYKGDPGKFSIIDPNRSDNDISGGAKNTGTIRKAFSIAFNSLQQRMGELHPADNRSGGPRSLLECIIGGNYRSFELQREHLAHVHEKLFGPVNRT